MYFVPGTQVSSACTDKLVEGWITLRVLSIAVDIIVISVTWTGMYSPVKEILKSRTRIGATSAVVLADGQWTSHNPRHVALNHDISRKPLFHVSNVALLSRTFRAHTHHGCSAMLLLNIVLIWGHFRVSPDVISWGALVRLMCYVAARRGLRHSAWSTEDTVSIQ